MADLNFNTSILDKSVDNASIREAKAAAQVKPLISDGSKFPMYEGMANFHERAMGSIQPALDASLTRDVKDYAVDKILTTPALQPILNAHGVGSFSNDPSTLPQTDADVRQFMEDRGIPENEWEPLMHGAVSKSHLEWRIQNKESKNNAQSLLAENGWVGQTASIGQGFIDPVTLLATWGAGAAVSGAAKGLYGAAKGAQVAEEALAAGTKTHLAVETAGAGAGGVAISGIEQTANGEDFDAAKAAGSAAQFMAIHLGMSAFKGIAAKREAEALRLQAEAEGKPVDPATADAMIHKEALPDSPEFPKDPNVERPIEIHQDPAKTNSREVPELHVPEHVDNELAYHLDEVRAEAAKAEPKDIAGGTPEVKPAETPVDVKPTAEFGSPKVDTEAEVKVPERDPIEKQIGLVEPYKSPKKKLYEYKTGRTDAKALTLKFENKVDRDLYHASFEPPPRDFQKVIGRLMKAKPEMTPEEIMGAARRFRTEDIRRYINDHPEHDELEVPTFHKNHMGPSEGMELGNAARIGAGVVAAGALLTAASSAQAGNGSGPGSVLGTAAELGVAAVAAVASKGKLKIPKIELPQAGLLKDLKIPFISKRWGHIPLGADFHDFVAVSTSNAYRFANALLLTGVSAKKGRAVSHLGADIIAENITRSTMGQTQKVYTTALKDWFKEKGYANYGKDYRSSKIQDFHNESYEYAMDPTKNDSPALRAYADAITEIRGKALDKVQQTIQQAAEQGVEFGKDSVAMALSKLTNKNDYVRLMFDFHNLRMMFAENEKGLRQMLFEGRMKARPDLAPDKAKVQSDLFLDTLMRLESDNEIIRLARTSPSEALTEMMNRGWATPESADDVMSVLTMLGSEKQLSLTQERFALDRTHSGVYDGQTMRVTDLYVRDLTVGMKDYVNQLSGVGALITVGMPHKLDLSSKANFMAIMDQGLKEGGSKKHQEILSAAYDYILGNKAHTNILGENNPWVGTALLATSTLLGKYFAAAVLPEGVAALMGSKMANSHRKSMPNLIDILKALTGKHPDDPYFRAQVAATGIGAEGIGSVMRESIEHGVGDKASRFVQVTANKSFLMNGLTGMNNLFKAVHAKGLAQYMLDFHTGRLKISAEDIQKNLHHYGLDESFLKELGPLLEKHSIRDSKNIIKNTNFEAIQRENPFIAAKFEAALRKHAVLGASEVASVGMRSPLLASTLGKVLFQFVQPVILATNRTRRDLGNFNADVAGRWAASFAMASMAYVAKTNLQYYGDDAELKKRLKVSEVMKAGFRNSMFSGLLPLSLDLASYSLGMDPVFANQTGRGFAAVAPPALGLPSIITGSVRTLSKAATGQAVTKGDVKNALMPAQLGQWWVQPAVNAIAGTFPAKLPKKPKPVEE